MYTFLACFFAHGGANRLERNASRIAGTLPGGSVATRCDLRKLDEVSGGWLIIQPSAPDRRPRITEFVTPGFATLVVGTTTTVDLPAKGILDVYQKGGLAKVREMEGNFSAIIVDRRRNEVFAFSDCIGTRTLRFCDGPEGLFIAFHDAVLIAAAAVAPNVDNVSAASGLLCGWSLQGRPLLSECTVISPDCILKGSRDNRVLVRDSILDAVPCLSATDTVGISRTKQKLRDDLVSNLQSNIEIEQPGRIRFALTAGVDTRAALALLLATRHPKNLMATTTGAPDSIDVRWARRISRLLGVEHEVVEPSIPTHDSFAKNLELLAYVTNGDTDGKRALSSAQTTAPGALLLSGLGGEIFRGYYYPYYERGRLLGGTRDASAEAVKSLLLRKVFSDFARLEVDADLKRRVEDRLGESLSAFDAYARSIYAYMDCFYLRERFGIWGALNSRRLWIRSLAPFHSVRAIRLALQLPPPLGNQRIQADIIKTFLPRRLYWMPVNGTELLSTHGAGKLNFLLRDGARRASVLAGRLLPQPQSQKSHERVRAELLAREVYGFLHEMLTAPGSFASDLMPKQALHQLLEDHRKKVNHAKALGYLATLETWRGVVRRATEPNHATRLQVHMLEGCHS